MVSGERKRAEFIYEDGKTVFHDFTGEQYRNYLRSRHLIIQGTLGEIVDDQITFMGEEGYPVITRLYRDEMGPYSNNDGEGLRSLKLLGKTIYWNPFVEKKYRLNDDEIAMAGILEGMYRYVKTGEEIYSLEEGLQDTYLYLMMDKAIAEGCEVHTDVILEK